MYCSSCGSAVAQHLTYCNHCGAKISRNQTDKLDKATELRAEWAIMSSMAALFVCGLVAIAILLGVMKSVLIFQEGPIMAFGFLSFLILIGLEAVYVSRLFRFRRDSETATDQSRLATNITKELEAQSRMTGEPVGSVTDHTTRTLDPVQR
jgi:predicted lipid-binding transport protein (Tim44 family)